MPRLDSKMAEAAYAAYQSGETLRAIGARLGMHRKSVLRTADRYAKSVGLPVLRRYGSDGGPVRPDVDHARDAEAYRDYVDGALLDDIAEVHGFGCRSSAKKAINRHAARNRLPKPTRLAKSRRRPRSVAVPVLGMKFRLDLDR